jgi:urea transporter/Flp pilus assembly protein TadD
MSRLAVEKFKPVLAILNGCAEIFFLQGAAAGGMLIAITLLFPHLALPAIIATLSAYGFACLIGIEPQFTEAGYYTYNPFLVGLSVGYLCRTDQFYNVNGLPVLLLAVLAGVLALLITALMVRLLVAGLWLPVLSLPFALTSCLVWLIATRYSHVIPAATHDHPLLTADLGLPLVITGLLRSFGALVFAPAVVPGILLALLILRYSRILFLLGVCGYYLGTLVRALFLGSFTLALNDSSAFNFYLIAMAVGGVFLVPSLRSGLVAMVAVAASALLLEVVVPFSRATGIPLFTFPFAIATLFTICSLRMVSSPLLAAGFGRTPEEVRENFLATRLRYGGVWRTLSLPFAGKWSVWQGNNGRWTHQGIWRYAYDFVIVDDEGRTHRDAGGQLKDYYCYRMPVLSPVAGRVVRVVNDMTDNPVGTVSGGSNWGNLVLLYDPRGFYVELSHFTPQSIRVKKGDEVEQGTVLGHCGNSGHSPQPHIHVQVQGSESPTAATLPFSFVNYVCDGLYYANDLPEEGLRIEPLCREKRLEEATSFVLDDLPQFEIFRDGQPAGNVTFRVGLAADGTRFLESDRGKLFLGKHEGTFYCYRIEGDDPYLRMLFVALPKLPLAYRAGLNWHDHVPISAVTSRPWRAILRLASLVWPPLACIKVMLAFTGRNTIKSSVKAGLLGPGTMYPWSAEAEVELDDQSGLARLRHGRTEMRRISPQDDHVARAPCTHGRRNFTQRSLSRSKLMIACGVLSLAAVTTVVGFVAEIKTDAQVRKAVEQSIQLEKEHDYPKAIDALIEPRAAHPDDYVLNLRLGWLYYLNGKYADSDTSFQAAIAAQPGSVEAKLFRLRPLLAAGKSKEAISLANVICKGNPNNYLANLRLAVALRLEHRYGDARRILDHLSTAYPADADCAAELAALNSAQAAEPGAPPAAAVAASEEATFADAIKRSLEFEAKLKYAEAIAAISEAYAAHPKNYTLNLRMGWLNYLSADHAKSARYYFKATEAAPRSIEAGLGYTLPLLAQGQYQDVESFARQILEGDPTNYLANLRLAFALRMQQKYDEAEKIVQPMLEAYPTNVLLLIERGMLDLAYNRKDAARAVFAEILMLEPDNAFAKEQLRNL